MISLIVLLSFLLDGIMSVFISSSFLGIIFFRPMFTVVTLVVIYSRYLRNQRDYYKICLILGIAYDLIYTNTPPLNTFLFLVLGFAICRLYLFFENNLLNSIIINVITLAIYHITTYIVLVLIGYLPFDIAIMSYDFPSILITNTVIFIITYCSFKTKWRIRKRRSRHSL